MKAYIYDDHLAGFQKYLQIVKLIMQLAIVSIRAAQGLQD